MRMPFGRRHDAMTVPTGSLSLRMTSRPAAIASTRSASSASRSRKAGVAPADLASARSSALAARIVRAGARGSPWPWRRARGSSAPPGRAPARAPPCAPRGRCRAWSASSSPLRASWNAATALSGAFIGSSRSYRPHGLDPSCIRELPTMFGQVRRGGRRAGSRQSVTHSNPQHSWARHRIQGTSPN